MGKAEGEIVGIDLGTTFSLVAVMKGGQPAVLPNVLGEVLVPSVVSVDEDGSLLVGRAAAERLLTHPERTVGGFKRDMGTDARYVLAGRKFTPVELSSLVLRTLKEEAEAILGRPVTEAVVTVPAYFGDAQRQATRAAGFLAGLKVERIINEPTAAALAYGLHHLKREFTAVVLDLGGGTFDVTVLQIAEGVVEVLGSSGDTRLGGEDFTHALMDWARTRLPAEVVPGPTVEAKLRDACERAKRALTDGERALIAMSGLPTQADPLELELPITRAEADACYRPLLDRLSTPIRRALADARRSMGDMDEVLLVGGATRMPCVVGVAVQTFGRLPRRELHPDEAVALGAAIQAALKRDDAAVEDLVVTDVAPFSLGIEIANHVGNQIVPGLFSPIIERGTVIPVSRVRHYATLIDYQKELIFPIYQGEHARSADNTLLATHTLKVPPKPRGQVSVQVRFTYDLNGLLEVELRHSDSDKVEHLVVEQRPGALTPEEVKQARAAMAALKIAPRETLPNRTALARADAAYQRVTGEARDYLMSHISLFEAALANQRPEEIDEARGLLLAAITRVGA